MRRDPCEAMALALVPPLSLQTNKGGEACQEAGALPGTLFMVVELLENFLFVIDSSITWVIARLNCTPPPLSCHEKWNA